MAAESPDDDRLFVKDGFKHYRRTYSRAEVQWGLACGGALLAITGWVAWRGAHQDPMLFQDPMTILEKAGSAGAVPLATALPTAGRSSPKEVEADRGALPDGLSGGGFREEKVSQFDSENLYVKIDGRSDFFKAYGFKRLYASTLVSETDPGMTIDVEMYDHGSASNALGAYGGERPADVKPQTDEAGMFHFERNALYMARGTYYLRIIGSDESAAVKEKLQALKTVLAAGVKGEAQPWGFDFFAKQVGIDWGNVAYFAENAFSMGFAEDVWTARPKGKNDDLELFINAMADSGSAAARATQYAKGFLQQGTKAGKAGTVPLAKDQFLSTFSGATAVGRFVIGVRGAIDAGSAGVELSRLRDAATKLPKELEARAVPVPKKQAGGSYE